jgi:hypothetical protein
VTKVQEQAHARAHTKKTVSILSNKKSHIKVKKSKTILMKGRCDMLEIPHCLDTRFTGGGEIVSFTRQPRFTTQIFFSPVSGTHSF